MGKILKINKSFGIAIRKLRTQQGWSQEKFAEYAEIHRTYVSSIELGKVTVSLEVAEKLATSFNISLSRLIKMAEKIQKGLE